jgi:hypothetical protein
MVDLRLIMIPFGIFKHFLNKQGAVTVVLYSSWIYYLYG